LVQHGLGEQFESLQKELDGGIPIESYLPGWVWRRGWEDMMKDEDDVERVGRVKIMMGVGLGTGDPLRNRGASTWPG
jgi:hypothetical protein